MTKLYPHQARIYEELKDKLSHHRVVCIAAVTGFGKTELIAKFIEDNPRKRFLVLAHGQTVLRTNFYERLLGKPKLKPSVIEIKSPSDLESKARIMVALPQTLFRHLNRLKKVDYLIVDEAHEYYLEDGDESEKAMYGAILSWHRGKEILLTASHYPLKKTPKIFFSREESMEIGQTDDVTIQVAGTSFDVKDLADSYNGSGELSQRIDVSASIADIVPYLKAKNYPMIISRHSIEAADELGEFLGKRKEFMGKFAVSHSQGDKDSSEIAAFKAGKFPILIVVQRGALGFDFPELVTYVDASFTRSLIRTEQMLGRVARRHPLKKPKHFIKLALESRVDEAFLLMAGVLALGERQIYRTWNSHEKSIPIKEEIITRIRARRSSANGSEFQPVSYLLSFSEYLGIRSLKTITFDSALDLIRKIKGTRIQKQEAIRQWARSGKPRPSRVSDREGYILFQAYLSPSSKCYEKTFADEIKEIRPEWFNGKSKESSAEKKKQLLALAKAGAPRPKREERLGNVLRQYTDPRIKRGCYDPEFSRDIKEVAPSWFSKEVQQ